MPFSISIEKESDIQALNLDQTAKAILERSEMLHKIIEESGEKYDASKVKIIEVKDGHDLAAQIRTRNTELTQLGERRDVLRGAEEAKERADRESRWANGLINDPRKFAPDGPKEDRQPVSKSLGEHITSLKSGQGPTYKEWTERGANGGLDFEVPEWPSDLLARSWVDTIGRKTLFQTTAGWAPESTRIPGIVEEVTRPIQLLDIIPLGRTSQEKVVYMEETTRTHAAAEASEGATFAESTFVLTEQESNVRKITDSLPVTDEQLEDVAQVESYVNGRLIFGLRQRLDTQVLIGDAVAPNLRGIKNVAGIQTQAKGADPAFDAFHKAMTLVRVTGRAMPTHHVIHPTDWQNLRLTRTADGVYILGNPSDAGTLRLWGNPVVVSDIDSAGTAYVGSFLPAWISLFERRGVDVQVGYTGTQFVQGRRTIRADARFAFVVFRPAAFATVTGL